MKKLCLLACSIALAAFLGACGDDEPSGPVPTVEFTQDRNFSEPGGTVTFTNSTVDADSYFWEFGDGGISTDENPTHTYMEKGDYTVTLKARGSGGQEASSTATVVVGSRFVTAISFIAVNPNNPDGEPWDDDETGPDLFFLIDETANVTDPRRFTVIDDLIQSQVPFEGSIDQEGQFALTDTDWTFILLDNDDPFDEISLAEDGDDLMLFAEGNPTQSGVVDFQSGQGILKLLTQDESVEIDLNFQIRN
ncbi:MAG: PKD domain-containing protein [Bacteroidota bacterium]